MFEAVPVTAFPIFSDRVVGWFVIGNSDSSELPVGRAVIGVEAIEFMPRIWVSVVRGALIF